MSCSWAAPRSPRARWMILAANLVVPREPQDSANPLRRRQNPAEPLTPVEVKQLRGVLGSLQRLVANVRADMLVQSHRPRDLQPRGSDRRFPWSVTKSGGVGEDSLQRLYSQAAYYVLIADAEVLAGREGSFCVLDARAHQLPRGVAQPSRQNFRWSPSLWTRSSTQCRLWWLHSIIQSGWRCIK